MRGMESTGYVGVSRYPVFFLTPPELGVMVQRSSKSCNFPGFLFLYIEIPLHPLLTLSKGVKVFLYIKSEIPENRDFSNFSGPYLRAPEELEGKLGIWRHLRNQYFPFRASEPLYRKVK